MRIMGLDFGAKTVGVAISDPLLITAQGIEIIRRKEENKLRRTLARIEELICEYGVEEIVLGLPKNMNDTLGERSGLTTVAAERAMMEAGIRRENRKEHVDRIAAVFILQGFLDLRALKEQERES